MSVTVTIFPDQPHAGLNTAGEQPFATIELSRHPARAVVALRTYQEADEFVRAAEEARRLLATFPPGDGAS